MTPEQQAAEVLAAHEDCAAGSTVEVHDDRTGTLHYPCGITVGPPVRGLANADRQHLAAALAAAGVTRDPDAHEAVERVRATYLPDLLVAAVKSTGRAQVLLARDSRLSEKHVSQMLTGAVDGSFEAWHRLLDAAGVDFPTYLRGLSQTANDTDGQRVTRARDVLATMGNPDDAQTASLLRDQTAAIDGAAHTTGHGRDE